LNPPWMPLTPRILAGPAVDRADPYLRMADATQFVDHLAPWPDAPNFPVSVELQSGARRPVIAGMAVPPVFDDDSAFFTARVTPAALNTLLGHADVKRAQLAEGILPQRPRQDHRTPWPSPAGPAAPPGNRPPTALLLGVIDAGCPFAHQDLRTPDGLGTRVVRLWDQDDGPGAPPARMGYGQERTDGELNQLMAEARDSQGRVDEHACYLRAGADLVLPRASHGAHALGLLAALRRYDGRPRPGLATPVVDCPGDAALADIAFVQLPRKLLNAAFPPAVEHQVLNGLRYLLDTGRQRGASRIMVSFAFESWVGPHDGSSWFEQAVQDLVQRARAAGIDFQVVLVAGNGGNRGVHRRLDDAAQPLPATGREATAHWRVQPDNQVPTYVELWVPRAAGVLDDLTIEVAPPGQPPLPPLGWGDAAAWPDATAPALCVVLDRTRVLGTQADMVLLRISPTRVFDPRQRGAPHGEWVIRLTASTSLAGIDLYIGRATGNFGSQRRGRQTALSRRSDAERRQDRHGTLNGYGNHAAATVATACVAATTVYRGPRSPTQPRHAAPYAGAGPSRDGGRQGPSFGVVVEHGPYHPGMIGIGNRSATTFRLVGTSVAGPLGARMLVDGDAADPGSYPAGDPDTPREVGAFTFAPRP